MANPESITQAEAARRLGRTTAWIRDLTVRGILSRNPDKSYPWPKVREEYEAFQAQSEIASSGAADLKAERARLTKLQADAQQFKNDVQRGKYLAVEEGRAEVRAALEDGDRVLKGAPRRLAKKWARRLKLKETETIELIELVVEDVRTLLREVAGDDDPASAA